MLNWSLAKDIEEAFDFFDKDLPRIIEKWYLEYFANVDKVQRFLKTKEGQELLKRYGHPYIPSENVQKNSEITDENSVNKTLPPLSKAPRAFQKVLLTTALIAQIFTACGPKAEVEEYVVKKGDTFTVVLEEEIKKMHKGYDRKTYADFHKRVLEEIQEDNKRLGKNGDLSKIYPWDKIIINKDIIANALEEEFADKEKENKDKQKENKDGPNVWPTVEKSSKRFDSGKKYFLESMEIKWEKSLLDIYKDVSIPKIIIVNKSFKSESGAGTPLKKVEKVVLHSTAALYDASKVESIARDAVYAHFLVTDEGKIIQINRNWKLRCMTHAWTSLWWNLNTKYFKDHSIGIEVEADAGKEWTDAQYKAVQSLLKWIAKNYNSNLKASDVITHSQIGYNAKGNSRGRKSDPYFVNWPKLSLPNNYVLYDPNVARGQVHSNLSYIKKDYPKDHVINMTIWLREAEKVANYKGLKPPTK